MTKLLSLFVFVISSAVAQLHLTGVKIPSHKMSGEIARLECPFEMDGQPLYAMKWFKDNDEFFRYIPLETPPIHAFNVGGIKVLLNESNEKVVTLGPLDVGYSGLYSCEVTADVYTFETVSGRGRMTVTDLPTETSQIQGKLASGVKVPQFKMNGEMARLECPLKLCGERLYAIKWYKDNEEFFRNMPHRKPSIRIRNLPDIQVVMHETDQRYVTLGPLNLRYSGVYRCEVTGDSPAFKTIWGEERMTVIHLPTKSPQIQGKSDDEYKAGDRLALNCVSAESYPPARLSWFINNIAIENGAEQVKPRKTSERLLQEEEIESWLNITLLPEHFNANGEATAKCVATIKLEENSTRPQTDFQNSSSSVASPTIFQQDMEALLLVRDGEAKSDEEYSGIETIRQYLPAIVVQIFETVTSLFMS